MGMRVRLVALLGGVLAALLPVAAFAEEGRGLERPQDFGAVTLLTAAGVAAVLLVAALGYLYRRRRGLEWDFQRGDATESREHH